MNTYKLTWFLAGITVTIEAETLIRAIQQAMCDHGGFASDWQVA